MRAAIGPRAALSIATPRIWPVLAEAPWPRIGPIWRADYYRAVARRVDQIAIMTYDSYLPHPALYRAWQHRQVIEASRAVDGLETQLLIGMPTSEEATRSHRPSSENMASGLRGLVDGLNDAAARPSAVAGAAIYPEWETDEAEWSAYQTIWTGRQAGR